MHWLSATVDDDGTVTVFDSLRIRQQARIKDVLMTILNVLAEGADHTRWAGLRDQWTLRYGEVPLQKNGSDCGIIATSQGLAFCGSTTLTEMDLESCLEWRRKTTESFFHLCRAQMEAEGTNIELPNFAVLYYLEIAAAEEKKTSHINEAPPTHMREGEKRENFFNDESDDEDEDAAPRPNDVN